MPISETVVSAVWTVKLSANNYQLLLCHSIRFFRNPLDRFEVESPRNFKLLQQIFELIIGEGAWETSGNKQTNQQTNKQTNKHIFIRAHICFSDEPIQIKFLLRQSKISLYQNQSLKNSFFGLIKNDFFFDKTFDLWLLVIFSSGHLIGQKISSVVCFTSIRLSRNIFPLVVSPPLPLTFLQSRRLRLTFLRSLRPQLNFLRSRRLRLTFLRSLRPQLNFLRSRRLRLTFLRSLRPQLNFLRSHRLRLTFLRSLRPQLNFLRSRRLRLTFLRSLRSQLNVIWSRRSVKLGNTEFWLRQSEKSNFGSGSLKIP